MAYAGANLDILNFGVSNVTFPRVHSEGLNTGDNDLYTCPAGRRALIIPQPGVSNNSGVGNIGYWWEVKISGSYYQLSLNQTSTVSNNSISANAIVVPIVLEAGESFSVHSLTNNGLTASVRVMEFDNTSGLKSVILTSFSAGNNTLYTCPTGKSTLLTGATLASSLPFFSAGAIGYNNLSGAGRTVSMNQVLSAGSPSSANLIFTSGTVSNNSCATASLGASVWTMNGGDFININVDAGTATQFAWCTVFEY